MTTSKDRLEILYGKYTGNTCTQAELEEFFAYVRDPAWKEALEAMADRQLDRMDIAKDLPKVDWEHMYRTIKPAEKPKKPVRMLIRIAAAASILLACTTVWLIMHKGREQTGTPVVAEKVIPPGYNKATLTLGDGSMIGLDSTHTGELTKQGTVTVFNEEGGGLAYNGTSETTANVLYNTLATPRGGQYQLTLPDGTKVWLNAASSITYPTAFTGRERTVLLTGEAYFEVVHNDKKPFKVRTPAYEIEDIGTHFNVNAYLDEPRQVTTLLEGAVKIRGNTLKPGEQATETGDRIIVEKGDPAKAIAWKNGFFYFSDANLQMVMRQLSRWYNVEVGYEGNIRERQFNGMIGRTLTLSQVLRGLSREGVHYRIEGNNHLIITP